MIDNLFMMHTLISLASHTPLLVSKTLDPFQTFSYDIMSIRLMIFRITDISPNGLPNSL